MTISERSIRDIVLSYVRPLRARLDNALARGVVKDLDDTTGLARGQSTTAADQVADDIEFVSPYGLSSRPRRGAETLVWSVGGFAGHLLGMIFDRRIRLKNTLDEGEVALHIGVAGQVVRLKANGDVIITPGTGRNVYLGDEGATKRLATVDDVNTLRLAFNTHTHPTAPPGVVSTPTVVPAQIPVPTLAGVDNVYGKG